MSFEDLSGFEYVDSSITSELLCSVCTEPFLNPHVLQCNHTFCLRCIKRLATPEAKLTCPLCKKECDFHTVRASERIINNMVSRLHVYCPNRAQGCPAQLERGCVSDHVQRACSYVIVTCPNDGCAVQTFRKFLDDHEKLCAHRLVMHSCGVKVKVMDLDEHSVSCANREESLGCQYCHTELDDVEQRKQHEMECPERMVPCPMAGYGCTTLSPLSELGQHEKQCTFARLSGFFSKYESRIQEQDDAIVELRHHLQASELRVANLLDALQSRIERDVMQTQTRMDIFAGVLRANMHHGPDGGDAEAAAAQLSKVASVSSAPADGTPTDSATFTAPTSAPEFGNGHVALLTSDAEQRMHSTGTLVEFQWFVKKLQRPRGSLISPSFKFGDIDWQLSVDGQDNGIYLAANGRGVRASYMISIVSDDLDERRKRNWVCVGEKEFGEMKWGSQGIMSLYYGRDMVITVAFLHVLTPINLVGSGEDWVVGLDSHQGTAQPTGPSAPEDQPFEDCFA